MPSCGALTAARRREAWRAGITTLEIKSGYGLTPIDERGACDVAERLHRRDHVPRRPRRAGRVRRPRRRLRRTSCAARCWPPRHRTRAGSTRSASRARSTPTSAGPCSQAGRAAGLGLRLHANQLGHGPGVQLAVELGCASADHCTYLSDDDIAALAARHHGRHVPAGDRLLDPPAVPRRPPGDRRRRHGRAGHQLQPGQQLHHVDGVLHRARRARHAHDRRRGAARGHRRGSGRAAAHRRRPPGARRPRRPGGARRPVVHAPRVPPRRAPDPPDASSAGRRRRRRTQRSERCN